MHVYGTRFSYLLNDAHLYEECVDWLVDGMPVVADADACSNQKRRAAGSKPEQFDARELNAFRLKYRLAYRQLQIVHQNARDVNSWFLSEQERISLLSFVISSSTHFLNHKFDSIFRAIASNLCPEDYLPDR